GYVAPDPLDPDIVYGGRLTRYDRRTGQAQNVTPRALRSASFRVLRTAPVLFSPTDPHTLYFASNTLWKTSDGGQAWTEISPDRGIVNPVREDPVRRGLLFAGTEQAVYVSFDDGESGQSLRLNMPATSIRDLVIKDDDLVVGTHGRGFWILDDITPLRLLAPPALQEAAFLFAPEEAWRFRGNKNTDTPLPPDEPAGANPPDGAMVHYFLKGPATGAVSLEIVHAGGQL